MIAPQVKPQESVHPSSPEQATGTSDATKDLRRFLNALLAAAHSNDARRLADLIKKTAIPIPRDRAADSSADYYPQGSIDAYRENLKEDEDALERKFMQFAKQSGTFLIRQVNNSPGPGERLDWEVLRVMQRQGDIFSAEWRPSTTADSSKGEAVSYLLGYFTVMPGQDRWANLGSPLPTKQQLLYPLPMQICEAEPSPECATRPMSIYAPDPEYSELARRKKIQTTIRLEVTVGADGRVHDVTVIKFSGYDLDEQSIKAVNQWKFEPAMIRGSPVPFRTRIDVSFRLY